MTDILPARMKSHRSGDNQSLGRPIRGIVLNEHADEVARLDMFDRINTGSKIANPSEIRRGVLQGPFLELVSELANSTTLALHAPMTAKARKERGYEELVTRFFAYGDGLADYKDRPAEFLFNYSKKMNAVFAADISLADAYRARFLLMLDFVGKNFPYGFKKSAGSGFTPRTRFEAIALGIDKALSEKPNLGLIPSEAFDITTWLESDDFKNVTGSDGANAVARLRTRIDYVWQRLVHADGI